MHYLAGLRDGQTPLDPDETSGLIPSWVATSVDLDRVEQEGIAQAIGWARVRRPRTTDILTEAFARQLHKRMFGEVWKWAGKYRVTSKNIGVDPASITQEIAKLMEDARYWVGEHSFSTAEAAVRFHHKLAWIHPFPNGNGRHSRLAADLLVAALGARQLSWGSELAGDPAAARTEYIAALREADAGDLERLVAFARR